MFVFHKSFKLSSLRLHHKVTLIIVEHKERDTCRATVSKREHVLRIFWYECLDQFTKSERVNSM